MAKVTSPRGSMNGWTLWEWFKGNWTTLKEVGKILIPLGLTSLATANPAILVVVTTLGKAGLDIIEYFIKEY